MTHVNYCILLLALPSSSEAFPLASPAISLAFPLASPLLIPIVSLALAAADSNQVLVLYFLPESHKSQESPTSSFYSFNSGIGNRPVNFLCGIFDSLDWFLEEAGRGGEPG